MTRVLVMGGGITGILVWNALRGKTNISLSIVEALNQRKAAKLTRFYGTNYLWEPIDKIRCVPFRVVTHVDGFPGTQESITRYKNKIGKPEDIGEWGLQFEVETTGYDFAETPRAAVSYEYKAIGIDTDKKEVRFENKSSIAYDVLVSTIPLNILVNLLGLEDGLPVDTMFRCSPIYIRLSPRPPDAPYPVDVMYVNYISDPTISCYRYCDRFGDRHYEALAPMGSIPYMKIYPGKIRQHPMVSGLIKQLASQSIYCFGRYASWSPNELVHETYRKITRWVTKEIV